MHTLQKSLCACFLLGIVYVSVSAPNAQGQIGSEYDPHAHKLSLTAEIVSVNSTVASYTRFKVDDGTIALRDTIEKTRLDLTLRLRFENKGNRSIILFKEVDHAPDWAISRNVKSAVARKYEQRASTDHVWNTSFFRPGGLDNQPALDQFVIIAPGESYEAQGHCIVTPYKNEQKLKYGTYVLELWMSTWVYSKQNPENYRIKWRDKGYLWSDVLKSEPIPFVIPN